MLASHGDTRAIKPLLSGLKTLQAGNSRGGTSYHSSANRIRRNFRKPARNHRHQQTFSARIDGECACGMVGIGKAGQAAKRWRLSLRASFCCLQLCCGDLGTVRTSRVTPDQVVRQGRRPLIRRRRRPPVRRGLPGRHAEHASGQSTHPENRARHDHQLHGRGVRHRGAVGLADLRPGLTEDQAAFFLSRSDCHSPLLASEFIRARWVNACWPAATFSFLPDHAFCGADCSARP